MDSTEVEDFLKELLIYNSEEYITKIKEMITCALAYQGSFENLEKISIRREANVLTRLFFRDTDLEEAHATSSNEILTYDFVANLMDDSALELNEWLIMRDDLLEENPTFYYTIVKCCEIAKSSLMNWDQDPIIGKGNQPLNYSSLK